jgi:hypothetical protein
MPDARVRLADERAARARDLAALRLARGVLCAAA